MIKKSKKIVLILLALMLISLNLSTEVFALKTKTPQVNKKVAGKEIYFNPASIEENKSPLSYYSARRFEINKYILTTNNDLFGIGTNKYGQLGKKGITESKTPIKILSDVKSFHPCQEENLYYVIKTNGELWGWGENLDGIVGNGKKGIIREPVKILDNVVEFHESGNREYYALTKNKELYSWGIEHFGLNDIINTKPVKFLHGVTKFDIGLYPYIYYAIVDENELWTWGRNSGSGTRSYSEKPIKIMDNVDSKIYTNSTLFYVINKDGELWGWASTTDEFNDQFLILGNGRKGAVLKPEKILDNVAEIYPEFSYPYALKKNGELWGWGSNYNSSLGNGKKGAVLKPVKIIDGVTQFLDFFGSRYVIKDKGDLWAWGDNGYSPIGDGTFSLDYFGMKGGNVVSKPKKIMSDVKYIDGSISCLGLMTSPFILKNNDELWGWGNHLDGFTYANELSKYPLTPRKLKENVAYGGYDLASHNYIVTKNFERWEWGPRTKNVAKKTHDNFGGKNSDIIFSSRFDSSTYGLIKDNGDVYIYSGSAPLVFTTSQMMTK